MALLQGVADGGIDGAAVWGQGRKLGDDIAGGSLTVSAERPPHIVHGLLGTLFTDTRGENPHVKRGLRIT